MLPLRSFVLMGIAIALGLPRSAPGADVTGADGPSLSDLAIMVTADHPREFIYTDKGAAHLAGEAVGPDTRSYHGFTIAMHEILDGWVLQLADGQEIGPQTAISAEVRPDRLVRRHRLADGTELTETVELFDRSNGFQVVYEGVPPGEFAVAPRVDMRFLWRVDRPSYRVNWDGGVLRIARQDRLQTPSGEHPAWLAVAVTGASGFEPEGRHLEAHYPKGAARRAMDHAFPYLPGRITGRIPPQVTAGTVEITFAADVDEAAAASRVRQLRSEAGRLAAARQARLEELLASTLILTGVEDQDRALAWARISLDNLIMEQRGLGIYAGFYWFTTYWGRDSFIVLPGACLTSGQYGLAEQILRSFAAHQERDESSPREGRLPNFVSVDQAQYAGVDGTWWFVRAVDEFWRRSGRDAFAAEMTPVVLRAVEGALHHAVDENGFLTHGPGETWMDAGGEAHPYSPRGSRAVEVQALFHRGLLLAARLAERFGWPAGVPGREVDARGAAARYRAQASRLAASFQRLFWRDGLLVDHLGPDGTPGRQVRPNGLLALLASPALFSPEQRRVVVEQAERSLVRPWGVLSLKADDPAFHAHHLDLAHYYYDEAYHNGDVWLWLSGPFVSARLGLARQAGGAGRGEVEPATAPPVAAAQTSMLLDEILREGAVGTLQEIRDGVPAESNDEFGGATSQAWSLSELLRALVDDYLGLEMDLAADPPLVTIDPLLPAAWPELAVRTRIGDRQAWIEYRRRAGGEPSGEHPRLVIRLDGELPPSCRLTLREGGRLLLADAQQEQVRQADGGVLITAP
jgi:glycogen debranching enzyme